MTRAGVSPRWGRRSHDSAAPGPGTNKPPSRFARSSTWVKAVVAAFTTAIVAAVATLVVSYMADRTGPDLKVVASVTQSPLMDYSQVLPGGVDPALMATSLKPGQLFPDGVEPRLVKVGTQGVRVVVQGQRSRSVVITEMTAHVLDRRMPVAGTLFRYGPQGSATVKLGFDLGSPDLTAREITGRGGLGEHYFSGEYEPIAKNGAQVFEVEAIAGRFSYDWKLSITAVVDGHSEVLEVGDADGHPFRVTGYLGSYSNAYDFAGRGGQGQWTAKGAVACTGAPAACEIP